MLSSTDAEESTDFGGEETSGVRLDQRARKIHYILEFLTYYMKVIESGFVIVKRK